MSKKTKKALLRRRRSEKAKRHRYSIAFFISALLSLLTICATAYTAGYGYASQECAIEHSGASAPTYVGLFSAFPYAASAAVLTILSIVFYCKSKRRERSCTEK